MPLASVTFRGLQILALLTVVGLTTSCGLVRAPFRIVGSLTRATVAAGKKAKFKAQARSERRKQEKAAEEAEQQQIEAADTMDGGVLPPLQDGTGGEAPELMLEPLPPPEEATLPALPQ